MKQNSDLFIEQKQKGDWGEEQFFKLAKLRYDKVNDYRNYEIHKMIQKRGIDFGVQKQQWNFEVFIDVKTNLYYSTYNDLNDYIFNICMKKYINTENEKDGWFLTSKAHRIYHWENKDRYNYLYYDLKEMRNFILREWDKPTDVNWIKKLSYVAGEKSDNALLIPICVNNEKFKPYIRQCHIKNNLYNNQRRLGNG